MALADATIEEEGRACGGHLVAFSPGRAVPRLATVPAKNSQSTPAVVILGNAWKLTGSGRFLLFFICS
ncbi:hypothetical protein SUGI_0121860 [Cryptomeria japonica]|nr:hypothetical protein SUGI_0121860 [Cryptomeria japonica]